jgi:2-succinyl-5-enolpyruvyl-6-hydroxy-3-cyclohexene-1-carboxylate synthase
MADAQPACHHARHPAGNPSWWWSEAIAAQLAAGGIGLAVLCPGNRNLPLLAALAASGIPCVSHLDERSGAFFALGHARHTGQAALVCVTSGSAVANCLPAICEAGAVGLPLLLLSADRPARLHGCEAPQTMPQAGAARDWAHIVAVPEAAPAAVAARHRAVAEALAALQHGPVQLNVPLDEPLTPEPLPGFSVPAEGPAPVPPRRCPPAGPSVAALTAARAGLRPGLRGLIVAGSDAVLSPAAVAALASVTGFPVLADAGSGLRAHDIPHLLWSADALCAGIARDWQADLIIRLGPAPLARTVFTWLQAQRCPVLRLDRRSTARDFCHEAFLHLGLPSHEQLAELAHAAADGDATWRSAWLMAQQHAATARERFLASAPWGEVVVAAAACAAADRNFLHLGNSLAVRHGNLHILPGAAPLRVHVQRGVNGIDGHVGGFAGANRAAGGGGRAFLGDLTLLHDLPGLGSCAGYDGQIVVLDNGGGGIFDVLPLGRHPQLLPLARTPQRFDPVLAAAAVGLPAVRVESRESLAAALAAGPGCRLIHAVVPAESTAQMGALLRAMDGQQGR